MKDNEKIIDWYKNQLTIDENNLEKEKLETIDKIKNLKKEELFKKEEKKFTLWSRLKKVLMGI